ncbi:Saccharopine dehydrogenase NADP binding domain [Popillia japonica]|uniref:Saccharopine dehydrogenase NADP binding domain n=1 Tax=Popillia japonica TaxID=7064 RepID=A0AAW1JBN4_POPJA
MLSKLDIILFGATGFTGKRTIPKLHDIIKSEKLSLTWGIAGRSEQKLKDTLKEIEKNDESSFGDIPIIVADVNDSESLVKMTSRATVVINMIGPYRFYGEPIIKACIATSTHYIDVTGEPEFMEKIQLYYHDEALKKDVTGEPEFMEKIQLYYHDEALKKNIYLISSCGMDSIPCDMGVIYMMKNFSGTLNSIEAFIHTTEEGGSHPGPSLNYATWESAVHGLANYKNLTEIRSKLFSNRLPQCKPTLKLRKIPSKNKITGNWSLPFPGADRSVALRTQRFLFEQYNQRPVQVHCYYDFEKYYNAILAIALGSIFSNMVKYEWSRSLLLKYPRLFSLGSFTLGGPSDEKQKASLYNIYLEGEGWSEKLAEPTDEFKSPPNKTISVKVSTRNAAYGATCTAAVLSAIMILTESDKMPNGGGCYTPGVAFGNTSLIQKLDKYGMKFEMRSKL